MSEYKLCVGINPTPKYLGVGLKINTLMRKIFYIVLDGLGDLPIKELRDKTPLEAAKTPNLDSLAKKEFYL